MVIFFTPEIGLNAAAASRLARSLTKPMTPKLDWKGGKLGIAAVAEALRTVSFDDTLAN